MAQRDRREYLRLWQANWRAKNTDAFREYRREHYAKNRERISKERRRRRAANPEIERTAANRRYAEQREERRRKAAEHRQSADVREKARSATEQWRLNNPERAKENSYRSFEKWHARLRNAFVESISPRVVFARDHGICGICCQRVEPDSKWEVDHVMPISKGGLHCYLNVQLAHRRCNRQKAATVPVDPMSR